MARLPHPRFLAAAIQACPETQSCPRCCSPPCALQLRMSTWVRESLIFKDHIFICCQWCFMAPCEGRKHGNHPRWHLPKRLQLPQPPAHLRKHHKSLNPTRPLLRKKWSKVQQKQVLSCRMSTLSRVLGHFGESFCRSAMLNTRAALGAIFVSQVRQEAAQRRVCCYQGRKPQLVSFSHQLAAV